MAAALPASLTSTKIRKGEMGLESGSAPNTPLPFLVTGMVCLSASVSAFSLFYLHCTCSGCSLELSKVSMGS